MNIARKIKNSNLLTDIFGEWLSFHDGDVVKVVLDRAPNSQFFGPGLETHIHVFEMTSEFDEKGFYKLTNILWCSWPFWKFYELCLNIVFS